jgi:hypothetical protein
MSSRVLALALAVVLQVTFATPAKAEAIEPLTVLAIAGAAVLVLVHIVYLVVANVEGPKMSQSPPLEGPAPRAESPRWRTWRVDVPREAPGQSSDRTHRNTRRISAAASGTAPRLRHATWPSGRTRTAPSRSICQRSRHRPSGIVVLATTTHRERVQRDAMRARGRADRLTPGVAGGAGQQHEAAAEEIERPTGVGPPARDPGVRGLGGPGRADGR